MIENSPKTRTYTRENIFYLTYKRNANGNKIEAAFLNYQISKIQKYDNTFRWLAYG